MQGRKKVVGLVALLALLGAALYAYQAHETAGGGAGARGRHVCRSAPLRHRRRAAHLPRGRDAPGDRIGFPADARRCGGRDAARGLVVPQA